MKIFSAVILDYSLPPPYILHLWYQIVSTLAIVWGEEKGRGRTQVGVNEILAKDLDSA